MEESFQFIICQRESELHIRIIEKEHQRESDANRGIGDVEDICKELEIRTADERHPLRPIEIEEGEIEHIHYPTFEPVAISSGIRAKRSHLRGERGIENHAIENAIEDIAGSAGSDHGESDNESGSEFGVSDSLTEAPYQTGDMLFWGGRGSTYHVALALDANTLEMAANPERGTVVQAISAWQPNFGVRNDKMAALVAQSSSSDDSTTTTSTVYSCQADYISPLADKSRIGKIWQDPYTSDTITDENQLKSALKSQLHDYPDVQYSMSWVTFKNNSQITNSIDIGNTGWLRDRYGLDVNVRIQSYTRYLDDHSGNNDSITFGNKIFDSTTWEVRQNQSQDRSRLIAELQKSSGSDVRNDSTVTMTDAQMQKIRQVTIGGGST